ncbi:hypothetical protein TDB9533_04302 [Thalassocella blandensis]|nr:hypothetical protein TDB9533_04302 [Thalassocella blandensis]
MPDVNPHEESFFSLQPLVTKLEAQPYVTLIALALLSCLIFYAPFIVNGEMAYVFRYWDGPNYVYLAKTLYVIPQDHPLSPYSEPEYFAAHLPLYPLIIRLLSFLGYNNAMLLTTMMFTVFSTVILYQLLKETRCVQSPLWSAFIALFIPARYLIYHSVGATEAPFVFFTLSSLLAYTRGQYFLAFTLAGLSGITRITGVLIGFAYFFLLVWQKRWRPMLLLPIVGIPLLLTFTFYAIHYGDFFAYFGVNLTENNSLLYFQPFYILQYYSSEGDDHSAELYLATYIIYGAGVCLLYDKNRVFFAYSLVTYLFSVFIFHQDLSRYLIPIAPLAIIVAYDSILANRLVKYSAPVFIYLSYLYAWNILPHNLIESWVYEDLLKALE